MKTFRGQSGQSRVGHHHFSRGPTLAGVAPGDVAERPPFGFLIGKSYDYHAGTIMDLANSSKPGFRVEQGANPHGPCARVCPTSSSSRPAFCPLRSMELKPRIAGVKTHGVCRMSHELFR